MTQAIAVSRPAFFLPRRAVAAAAGVCALGAMGVLYASDPATSHQFPPCPFHYCTGFYCPGCGTLRALHSLLHGNLPAAWSLNPLLVISIPFIALLLLERSQWTLPAPLRIFVSARAKRMIPVAVLAFFVLRNIPCQPFVLLAPH